jgi:SAM-dependent methyltransferase
LIHHGAEVVAIDASARMIELTKQRLKRSNGIFQADLGQRLTFLRSSSFDVVLSPLVLNYLEDWTVTLAEFYRVLDSPGHLVISVQHPFFDYTYFKSDNYFRTELVGTEWKGFGDVRVYMPCFRRSLGDVLNPIIDTGFRLERILEPKPTEDFKRVDPKGYEELSRFPSFVCIRAKK